MLSQVAVAQNRAARILTLRHPNAMDCTVWRKKLLRTGPAGDDLGGIPNVGGMGVLDGEDEAEYDFEPVGDARIVIAGIWQGDGANWNDADTGVIYDQAPKEALIEFIDEANGYVQKPDRISVEPGAGIVLVYEVIGENSPTNIPPYNRRYIIAARADTEASVG